MTTDRERLIAAMSRLERFRADARVAAPWCFSGVIAWQASQLARLEAEQTAARILAAEAGEGVQA